jgi:hypothetical protein
MRRGTRVLIPVAALVAVALTIGSVATAKQCTILKSSPGCAMGGVKTVEKHEGKMKAFEKCEGAIAKLYEKYEDEFAAIHEKHAEKIVEISGEIEAVGKEIDGIATADEPDLGRLESRLKKMSDLRFELTKLKFRMHKEASRVVDEGDRLELDRHFAMMAGCCGGEGFQATYHPGKRAFDLKAWCPGGMPGHCLGKGHAKWCCPGGKASHCLGKGHMKGCCPGHKGHASLESPRVMFVGEKGGHADIQILDDVHGVPGCAPGTLGEKHIEVLVDEERDGVRTLKVRVDGEHGEGEHFEFMLDDEDLDADVQRIIKKVHGTPGGLEHYEKDRREVIRKIHKVPADEDDELIWHGRGGSVGPF